MRVELRLGLTWASAGHIVHLIMQGWRSKFRRFAGMIALLQAAVLPLAPVAVHCATNAAVLPAQPASAVCPHHHGAEGAACPMHSTSTGTDQRGACTMTACDTGAARLFVLAGSVGVLVSPVEVTKPLSVAPAFALSVVFLSDFSPSPSPPPPRG